MFLFQFIILISFCYTKVAAAGCSFSFDTDFPENAPLIFQSDDINLVTPVKDGAFQGVRLKEGDIVDLVCVGEGNEFETQSIVNGIDVDRPSKRRRTCNGGILQGTGDSGPMKSHVCRAPNKSDPKFTESKIVDISQFSCGKEREGNLYQIGCYADDGAQKDLIKICFSPERSITYYTQHEISGEKVPVVADKKQHRFKKGNPSKPYFPDGFKPENSYTQKNVKATLKKLFPSFYQQILDENGIINRGHLSPARDFSYYKTVRRGTFYYINAVPHWKKLNCQVWQRVENAVRSYAYVNRPRIIDVYTGSFDILSFSGISIFLGSNNKLPIPKFIWKIVRDNKDNRGIVFILYNDLYNSKSLLDKDWPCEKPLNCDDFKWNIKSSPETGLVTCCAVADFKNKIKYTGISKMDVSDILEGNNIVDDALDDYCDDCNESRGCECCSGCNDENFCDLDDDSFYNLFNLLNLNDL